jgi:ABC-type nitrate/sulfonate/bicarbonate transport system permease component
MTESVINIKQYNYWDNLNKPFVIWNILFSVLELCIGLMTGAVLGFMFAALFLAIAAYGFYSALPPKWVRDSMGKWV